MLLNDRNQLLQILTLHNRSRRIVRERHDQNLRFRRDCRFKLLRCQTKLILFLQLNHNRLSVCHDHARLVGDIGGLRDQNLISGIDHCAHRKVNGLGAAHRHENL